MKLLSAVLFLITFSGLAKAQEVTLNPCDQNGINQALAAEGTVYLNAGIYDITGPINLPANTCLTGDSNAIIQVSSTSSQWFTGSTGIITCTDPQNIMVSNIQVDGNLENLPHSYNSNDQDPHNCERAIFVIGGSTERGNNITISNMKIFDTFSDGVHVRFCDNVHVSNLEESDCQHEGVYFCEDFNSEISGCKIAGITSDCLRVENCKNVLVHENLLYSYSGTNNNGAYEHGEAGLQVGNQGRSFGTGSPKPDSIQDIEIFNNTFVNDGLEAIAADPVALESASNVYIHNNQFIGKAELSTMGVPVDVGNVSYTNPPTIQQSESVFSTIFDALNLKYADNGFTNQTADEIQYTVQQTEQGAIAGGIKIIGFSNMVNIDGVNYIPDNKSILVKYAAVKAPSFTFVSGGVSNIISTVNTSIVNGTAYATLTVQMEYYTVATNSITKKSIKNYHVSTATFNDSCKSPDVLERPQTISGIIYQYPTFFMVSVPSNGLTKIHYEYAGNSTDHIFLVGCRNYSSNGIECTDFSSLEHWEGSLQHSGSWLYVLGEFDKSKLSVIAYTPYESQTVSDFNITKFNYPKTIIANWFYPEIAFLAISFIFGKWLFNQMKYN
jgi:hypothetical protein